MKLSEYPRALENLGVAKMNGNEILCRLLDAKAHEPADRTPWP